MTLLWVTACHAVVGLDDFSKDESSTSSTASSSMTGLVVTAVSSGLTAVSNATATATASSGTGMSACDDRSECGDVRTGCVACALNGPCSQEVEACQASPECVALQRCLAGCAGDGVCRQDCNIQLPAGAAVYNDVLTCVYCDQCDFVCPEFEGCF